MDTPLFSFLELPHSFRHGHFWEMISYYLSEASKARDFGIVFWSLLSSLYNVMPSLRGEESWVSGVTRLRNGRTMGTFMRGVTDAGKG